MEYHPRMVFSTRPPPPRDPREVIDPAKEHWPGIFDPTNPKEWWPFKKVYHSFVPALAVFVVSFAASIYAPAIFDLEAAFEAPITGVVAGMSTYLVGIALGSHFAGPLSELTGRRAIYFVALPIFGAFTLGVAYARNTATLLICRFFAGMFGGSVMSLGAGTVADMYLTYYSSSTYANILFLSSAFLGPILGPLAGNHLLVNGFNWQWTMFLVCMITLPVFFCLFFTDETHKTKILKRKYREKGFQIKKYSAKEKISMVFCKLLTRPFRMLVREPIVCLISIYNAFTFAIFYGYFESVPFVLKITYDLSAQDIGASFLTIGIGAILAIIYCVLMEQYFYQARMHSRPRFTEIPEERMVGALFGSLCFPAGMLVFSLTAQPHIGLIFPLIGLVLLGFGAVSTFISLVVYLVHIYKAELGASAVAATSFVQYLMAAAFSLFMFQMHTTLGFEVSGAILSGIATAFVPIPWIIFFLGSKLRKMTYFLDPRKSELKEERRRKTLRERVVNNIHRRFSVIWEKDPDEEFRIDTTF